MPNDIKNAVNNFITGISKIVGNKLEKVILYGSYARNTQNQDGEIQKIT